MVNSRPSIVHQPPVVLLFTRGLGSITLDELSVALALLDIDDTGRGIRSHDYSTTFSCLVFPSLAKNLDPQAYTIREIDLSAHEYLSGHSSR